MPHPIVRTLSWMATLAALAALATWTLGRLLSDQFEWSQYLFWVPPLAVLTLAGVLLLVASAFARYARGLAAADSLAARPPASRSRKLAWAAWLGVLAWMSLAEWHLHRYIAPVSTPAGAPRLRVMYWNPVSAARLPEHVAAAAPDLLVIANPPARADWVAVRAGVQGDAPASTARYDRITIVSRYPILRWAGTSLNIKGARPRTFIFRGGGYVVQDHGQALFAEIDTTALLGRTTVVWALDLPSDFNLSRWTVMRQSAAALANFEGPAFSRTPEGLDQPAALDQGFPTPDLILGDFNTPRGSASLTEVSGSMAHAFDHAGRGLGATWPRRWPAFAIDQAFVGPDLRATLYKVIDPGEGHHRALLLEVVEKDP